MNQQGDEHQSNRMSAANIMMEAMKNNIEAMRNNQQMVCQVGELIKELQLSRQSALSYRNQQPQIGYQPIVGTIGKQTHVNRTAAASAQNQPSYNSQPQSQSSYNQPAHNPQQANANRQFHPRSEIQCYSCGGMGHRSNECNTNNRSEHQEGAQVGARGAALPRTSNLPAPASAPALSTSIPAPIPGSASAQLGQAQVIQPAACVDITDEELGLIYSTDPFGTMMMSTKMVDLVQEEAKAVDVVQEEERIAGMGAYLDSLTDK